MIQLSVIMPTYNRLARLQQVLRGLEQQSYPLECFEVVVVSDGSTDDTDTYLSNIETALTLVPVFQTNQGPAAARNKGVWTARGEIILFLDDDVVPSPQLVQTHMQAHEANGDKAVVLGTMLTPDNHKLAAWVDWEQAMLYKQYDQMREGRWPPTARQFYTGNTSIARRHLLAVGGFDTQFRRAEDVELAYRLRKLEVRFVFVPEAMGYHYAERSFQSWMNTPYEYGRNDIIFSQQKGQDWLLPTIFREFHERHPLLQRVVRIFLDKPQMSKWAINALKICAQIGSKLSLPQIGRMAYSCIFNLRYYQGVADQLGGRATLFAGVDAES